MDLRIIESDVIVLGSGGAGLMAAISACSYGAKTVILSKGKINRSGATLLAGAGISADIGCDGGSLAQMGIDDTFADDTPEKWFQDIVREGMYLNEQNLVEKYVELAPVCLKEIMEWGMPVFGMEGDRGVSVSSRGILDALYSKLKKLNIEEYGDVISLDIVMQGGKAYGVLAWSILDNELLFFQSSSVIVASGGMHGAYSLNTGSYDLSGDGQAICFRAGVEMADMEMVSFCPTTVVSPLTYRGNILPYILCTLGHGQLVNSRKEDFIAQYYTGKTLDMALTSEWNKLLLSRVIYKESYGNKQRHEPVYYSMKHCAQRDLEYLKGKFPGLTGQYYNEIFKALSSGEPIEIAPAAHYFEGGARINERCETSLRGLYAAGECAGGLFGANRVTAATTEMLILGRIAGEEAAKFAKKNVKDSKTHSLVYDYIEENYDPSGKGMDPGYVMEELGRLKGLASLNLGVERNQEGINEVLECSEQILQTIGSHKILPLENENRLLKNNMLKLRNVAECIRMIAKSSLAREESRGVFYRTDIPFTDNDKWLKHIILQRNGSFVNVKYDDINCKYISLPKGKFQYQDFLTRVASNLV